MAGADTPVMRQYQAAKEQHPDALVFFRLGDFYELFYEDAVVAAKLLDLTLTSRNKNAVDPISMAGVPFHAASGYIQKLIDAGYKVALCEQMADPSKTKGIVPREVVRVVTPGIVFDEGSIAASENHFLVAVDLSTDGYGIAALDLSTGEFIACSVSSSSELMGELMRLEPREVLLGSEASGLRKTLESMLPRCPIRSDGVLDVDAGAMITSVVGEDIPAALTAIARTASARCLRYARDCERGKALPITRLAAYEPGDALVMDETSQAHLELTLAQSGERRGSLLAELDETCTAGGGRLLRRWLLAPRRNVAEIRRRLDAVELFVQQPGLRSELRLALDDIFDLERLAVKVSLDRASPKDLASIRTSLRVLPRIEGLFRSLDPLAVREVFAGKADAGIDTCAELEALLARAIDDEPPHKLGDGKTIRDGYDADLDRTRDLAHDGQRLIAELEARLREAAQIASLKLRYTRVFGWYIEVTRSHLAKVPDGWRRKQTVSTGERYTTNELDKLAEDLAHAEDRGQSLEGDLFRELLHTVARSAGRLHTVAETLARLDVLSSLAEVAHRHDYTRPEVDDSLVLEIVDGRHPVVERIAAAGRFVPNDVTLSAEEHAQEPSLWLVTGPNMAGKSTFMRQVALLVVMAQMGSFVPARRARIGVVDRVLTRVGASDNLSRGESTFMVEMKETAHVLRSATRRSLVVLDEIGRGTSTYDGLAIAFAVAEYLHDAIACRSLFATHYHELTELTQTRLRAANYSVSAREYEKTIVFFHKVSAGAASRSYGVACAQLAGVPEPVLARARTLLAQFEAGQPLRRAKRQNVPQLDLFSQQAEKVAAEHPALQTLKHAKLEEMTPLEAIKFLDQLQKMIVS